MSATEENKPVTSGTEQFTKKTRESTRPKFAAGNSGRPKGVLNKTTRLAKEAIALAAEELGGAERIVEWAKEDPLNERAFWTAVYPKLLPLQVTGENGGPISFEKIVREIVDPATK